MSDGVSQKASNTEEPSPGSEGPPSAVQRRRSSRLAQSAPANSSGRQRASIYEGSALSNEGSTSSAEGPISARRDSRKWPANDELRALKAVIARQMNRSGNTLLAGLEPVNDDEFYAVAPNGISAAWTIGHIACVNDLFSSWFAGGRMLLDAATHKIFNNLEIAEPSGISKGASVDRQVRTKRKLLLHLRQTQVKALQVLEDFDPSSWESPIPSGLPDTLMTCGAVWEHLAVHTYWHLGELGALMPRFYGTYTLNTLPHYFYYPPQGG